MLLITELLGIAVILSVIARYYLKRPYAAVVDDIEFSTRTGSDGESRETVVISYSSKGSKYGKIRLPKRTFEKHLPTLEAGDRILKYRGDVVPRLLERVGSRPD